jgi:hypothetical protein
MIVRMKSALVALMLACATAHAASVDELVAKNLQARGGVARLQAIQTLKAEGKLLFGGQFELGLAQYQKAPQSVRNEASLQGLTAVQAWDGKEAWQISPFQGRKDPEKMTPDDAKAFADDAPIGGPLFDWQARGSKVEYLGTEDVDGTEAHKLKVTLKNGDIDYVYLDPDHWLEIRVVAQRTVRGTQIVSSNDYGDYEEVAGVYFPFSISTVNKADGSTQQVTIEKMEANVPLDDTLFSFPNPATTRGAGQ